MKIIENRTAPWQTDKNIKIKFIKLPQRKYTVQSMLTFSVLNKACTNPLLCSSYAETVRSSFNNNSNSSNAEIISPFQESSA